ncbi:hypothetical protein KY320_01315, partial [Candidatus Woesearchaeota archaeon]|nr:hypothetical protein [Candidatus Woesearchaeota archaeon]
MLKRGQITVFIILIIVIAISFGLIFYLKNLNAKSISGAAAAPLNVNAVQFFVSGCLESVGKEGIFEVGKHGGYYLKPRSSTEINSYWIANYYEKGVVLVPEREVLEHELELYINANLGKCLDFSTFKDQGYVIKRGKTGSKVKILDDKILLTLDCPLTVTLFSNQYRFETYSGEVAVRYGLAIDTARRIAEKIEAEPDYRDLT